MEAFELARVLIFFSGLLVGMGLTLGILAAIIYLGLTRFR